MFLAIFLSFFSLSDPIKLQGTPKFIRGSPQTEVFFKELKDSYIIANTPNHNQFLNVFLQAQKSVKPVDFTADSKSRVILSVGVAEKPVENKNATTETLAVPTVVPKPQFKEISN